MVYFIRRYGKMFKDYGPMDDVIFVVQADNAIRIPGSNGWEADNPQIVYAQNGSKATEASALSLAKGFLWDSFVGNEHDLIQELFNKEKGNS